MSKETKRPLGGLLVTQFFGAFNDNAWKQLVLLLGMNSVYIAGQGNETANLNWVTWSFLALTSALFIFTLPSA